MFADEFLVGCVVDAVNLVSRHVAVNPLNGGAKLLQDSARGLRDSLELLRRHVASAGDFAFDHVLGQVVEPPQVAEPEF